KGRQLRILAQPACFRGGADMRQVLKLNGQTIPTPRENITIEYIEISRTERTITGRMAKDIIAIKRRFTLTYQGLTSEQALIFLNVYRSGRPVTFEYIDVQGVQTARVYIMSLPREIFTPRPRYTQNVTIMMEEE